MNHTIFLWMAQWMHVLGDWSVRLSAPIAVLIVWFALRPPRTAAIRLLVCRMVLLGGLLLPFVPHVWGPIVTADPHSVDGITADSATTLPATVENATAPLPEDASISLPYRPSSMPTIRNPGLQSSINNPSLPHVTPSTNFVPLALAVLWATGVCVQLIRMLVGWRWLVRLRRSATPAAAQLFDELESCRSQLQVNRHVELRTHSAVTTPILVGGRQPCILAPADWQTLSSASRKAILLHELAHVQRRDDVTKLGEELVRAVFFFHPLVYWLLAQIDADREEVCDGAVVRAEVAPGDLAAVLLEFSKAGGGGQAKAALRSLSLPFFRRRMVKHRIQSLLEDQAMSWTTYFPSRRRMAAIFAVAAALFAAIGSFGLRAEDSTKNNPTDSPADASAKVTGGANADGQEVPRIVIGEGLTPEDIADLQAGKEVEVKGYGKLNLQQLAILSWMQSEKTPAHGRLVDVEGQPFTAQPGHGVPAKLTSFGRADSCFPIGDRTNPVNAEGKFFIPPPPDGIEPGRMIPLWVQTDGGQSFECSFLLAEGKTVDVHVPTHLHPKAAPPHDVAPNELAGLIVDEHGQPLEGVAVDLYEGLPKLGAVTGKDGIFRIKGDGIEATDVAEVRFRKEGYCPLRSVNQHFGAKDWVIALDNKTYFEGVVLGASDGKPAANAEIRANQGPKQNKDGALPELWTETKTDADGHYRLYVQPDEYEFFVKAPNVGVARLPKRPIQYGEHQQLDIRPVKGINFQATVLDSQTNQPVPNVRLWNWQYPGVEGRSDANGKLAIPEMLPGDFEFDIEADGYIRMWSVQAKAVELRELIEDQEKDWQTNFNWLNFDLTPGMKPVKIFVEKAARIRGRVIDPNGKPVAGATVAPAKTGTGNSLTGDTRFSVETKDDGSFDMLLPASHHHKYNLVAHDGKYNEWRNWANGILQPFNTTPGQQIDDVEIKLTKPATIRGKVVDADGKPWAGVEVQSEAADKFDNRYYTPLPAKTNADGSYEVRFLRPGEYVASCQSVSGQTFNEGKTPFKVDEGAEVKDVKITVKAAEPYNP